MKVAICCIAKNEDNYIDEWIEYHLKLGIDDIHIHQNNWKYNGKFLNNERVILEQNFDNDFKISQLNKYNEFIKKYHKVYDWAIFIDIDEFISLKQDNNIKTFLSKYEQYKSVGLNWNMFGTNNIQFDGVNFSCINRFKYCGKKLDHHIKIMLHLSLTGDEGRFVFNPHNIVQSNWTITVDKKKFINGPWNESQLYDKSIAVLNHYYFKTKQQFMIKSKRNDISFDYFDKMKHQPNVSEELDEHIFNFYNFNSVPNTDK